MVTAKIIVIEVGLRVGELGSSYHLRLLLVVVRISMPVVTKLFAFN